MGGTRQRHFHRTNFELRKLPENAPTPTTPAPAPFAGDRVHALLAAVCLKRTHLELCASAIAEEITSSLTPFFRRLLISADTSTLLSNRSRSARNP